MEFNAPAELGWQALKYAAHKLPATDRAHFEAALGEDQTAREAVAQAVELSHTVAALHASSAYALAPAGTALSDLTSPEELALSADQNFALVEPRRAARQSWKSSLGWLALGAAACLAGVLVWPHTPSVPSNLDQSGILEQAGTRDLISARWADLQDAQNALVANDQTTETATGDRGLNDRAASDEAVDNTASVDDSARGSAEIGGASSANSNEEATVPNWLVLGVEKDASSPD
ncbi:MAG TPA: hypothetical protein VFE24_04455 [Pirellulales bacterium]|nr:hypothetical protein [Pirellulales bacterium]